MYDMTLIDDKRDTFCWSFLLLTVLLCLTILDGLLEATLSPARLPKPLKLATLLMGLAVPILISAGIFIQLAGTVIGTMVRFDRYSLWHSCKSTNMIQLLNVLCL